MWYYAEEERKFCQDEEEPIGVSNFDDKFEACVIWRRFANLWETSQSLFWASFGLVDLESFDLHGIKEFTRSFELGNFDERLFNKIYSLIWQNLSHLY